METSEGLSESPPALLSGNTRKRMRGLHLGRDAATDTKKNSSRCPARPLPSFRPSSIARSRLSGSSSYIFIHHNSWQGPLSLSNHILSRQKWLPVPPPHPPPIPNPSTGCTPGSSKCWFWLCLFICPTHSEVTRGVVFDTASQISPTLHTNINIWPQLLKISPMKKKKKVEKYQPCVVEE